MIATEIQELFEHTYLFLYQSFEYFKFSNYYGILAILITSHICGAHIPYCQLFLMTITSL